MALVRRMTLADVSQLTRKTGKLAIHIPLNAYADYGYGAPEKGLTSSETVPSLDSIADHWIAERILARGRAFYTPYIVLMVDLRYRSGEPRR